MLEYLEFVWFVEKWLVFDDKLKDFEVNIMLDIKKELLCFNVWIEDYVVLNVGVDIIIKVRFMMDINVLVFWSDVICVISFMFGNLVSNCNFIFLDGVIGNYYMILYYRDNVNLLDMYVWINYWYIE